jgi:hypothetical protein
VYVVDRQVGQFRNRYATVIAASGRFRTREISEAAAALNI